MPTHLVRSLLLALLVLFSLSAQVVDLAFAVQLGKPEQVMSISSGSGMVPNGNGYLVVGDDTPYLFTVNRHFELRDQTLLKPYPMEYRRIDKAIKPDYALGPHTASLGLTFNTSDRFGEARRDGAFIGQHGSWNRRPPSGYRVVFIPFAGGRPSGPPEAFLTGFLNARDEAQGRPVGVAVDRTGALLVADDVGKAVWRVAATGTSR